MPAGKVFIPAKRSMVKKKNCDWVNEWLWTCPSLICSESLKFITIIFSTVNLVEKLKKGTFSCGTVRRDRLGLPQLKADKNMKKGDIDFSQSGDVSLVKWKDRESKAV